jgi:DNA-binding transcriptional MerR regulator
MRSGRVGELDSRERKREIKAREGWSDLHVDPDQQAGELFSIRDLIKEFCVSARTLRFYEEKGLMAPRRDGRGRLYSRRDRARLRYVLMGKAVGFSLDEIREMLDLYDLGDGGVTQLRVALKKFAEQIGRLQRQKATIDGTIAELERASAAVRKMLANRCEERPVKSSSRPAR